MSKYIEDATCSMIARRGTNRSMATPFGATVVHMRHEERMVRYLEISGSGMAVDFVTGRCSMRNDERCATSGRLETVSPNVLGFHTNVFSQLHAVTKCKCKMNAIGHPYANAHIKDLCAIFLKYNHTALGVSTPRVISHIFHSLEAFDHLGRVTIDGIIDVYRDTTNWIAKASGCLVPDAVCYFLMWARHYGIPVDEKVISGVSSHCRFYREQSFWSLR